MNPLISDRFVDFLAFEVLHLESLCKLPAFSEHSRAATFQPWLDACRRLARQTLYPAYRAMDADPPRLVNGEVKVSPLMKEVWPKLVELGVIGASRPTEVGGGQLPMTLSNLGIGYLMAANLSASGFAFLTTGAAHLIEAFGSEALKAQYLDKMYSGQWTGTMALTEPQAGSSLADLTTRATPAGEHYLLKGSKIFISGGGQDLTENIVNLTLARIDGAEPGTRGISLFAVPKLRPRAGGGLEPNDVQVSGLIHKIGWRGLPSVALALGDEGDCRGWLVGAPGQGLKLMFQMMNEARLIIGLNGIATASVAFHESLAYARERKQGRKPGTTDPRAQPVALVEHADVRRMLLRQKAIVEGGLGLVTMASRYADLAMHAVDDAERSRARLLLDLLTPIAKTFPAEHGYESNTLALQIHGGYGYSSEYLPEAWLRDQKLNSIHEGTTTIQGLDLLGRKAVAQGGAALMAFNEEVEADLAVAAKRGLDVKPVRDALARALELSASLGARGAEGDLEGMLGHSADYLELMSVLVIAWVWMKLAAQAPADDFGRGLKQAAEYWVRTEIPRVALLADRCDSAERSYLDLNPDWL
jgi:alkylation response protein AidB-like acyl-CoA dehydrogenase